MQQCITDRINHADSGNYSVSPTVWLSRSLPLVNFINAWYVRVFNQVN